MVGIVLYLDTSKQLKMKSNQIAPASCMCWNSFMELAKDNIDVVGFIKTFSESFASYIQFW